MLTIIFSRSTYTPEDVECGSDASESDTYTHTYDSMDEIVEDLKGQGITEASVYPLTLLDCNPNAWLSAETYEHPFSGNRQEVSAHCGSDMEDETWIEIMKRVTA